MSEPAHNPERATAQALRERAEEQVRKLTLADPTPYTPADALLLLHELQIHRVELELQNEELRNARNALEAALARYTELFDFAPLAYLTVGREGIIKQANQACATLLENAKLTLQGLHIQRFLAPKDRTRFNTFLLELQPGEPASSEEFELILPNNSTKLTKIDGHCHTQEAGCHLMLSDISQQRLMEQQRTELQLQLQQAKNMESIGRLAGGVAHDFNNTLQTIVLNIELAREMLPPGSPLEEGLHDVNLVAKRSSHLIAQLVTFARKQSIRPRTIDLNKTLAELSRVMQRLIGEDIALVWAPHAETLTVNMDPAQVDCVMTNLCLNARDAIHEAQRQSRAAGPPPVPGRITVETRKRWIDASETHEGAPAREYVEITVKDNGCGMDAETREKIFEPFFTTKANGQGTGLGLATVHGIVHQNKGRLHVESEPGIGTTLTISLPVHAIQTPEKVIQPERHTASAVSECLLIVEDEPSILASTTRYLRHLGYEVHAADSPRKAIEIAGREGPRLHLLLTDVIMPEMNGAELTAHIRTLCPDIKCLYMSGYSAEILGEKGVLKKDLNLVEKPFDCNTLANKIRETLNQAKLKGQPQG